MTEERKAKSDCTLSDRSRWDQLTWFSLRPCRASSSAAVCGVWQSLECPPETENMATVQPIASTASKISKQCWGLPSFPLRALQYITIL